MSAEYFITAHGREIGTFKLPKNIRVMLLCSQTGFTACSTNEIRLWSSVMNGIGENMETFIENYSKHKPSDVSLLKTEFCIFTPNSEINSVSNLGMIDKENVSSIQMLFNNNDGMCPNIKFSHEAINFRTGVFKLPIKFKRVYHSDYTSTKTGSFKPAGTIEDVDITKTTDLGQKIASNRPLNRIENMLIRPTPSIEEKKFNVTQKKEHAELLLRTKPDIIEYFSNVMSTCSFIIPVTDSYISLSQLEIKNNTLETIVDLISRENPLILCTIIVSACRNLVQECKTPDGIPLEKYINGIKTHNQALFDIDADNAANRKCHENSPYMLKNTMQGDKYIFDLTYQQWDQYIFEKRLTTQTPRHLLLGGKDINYKKKYKKYKKKYNSVINI